MKALLFLLLALSVYGCAIHVVEVDVGDAQYHYNKVTIPFDIVEVGKE